MTTGAGSPVGCHDGRVTVDTLRGSRGRAELVLGLARIGALGVLAFGVDQQLMGPLGRDHFAAPILIGLACVAWLAWLAARRAGASRALTLGSLCVLSAAGGALVAYAPLALSFPAVAALGAAVAVAPRQAVRIGAVGVAAVAVAVLVRHSPARGELVAEAVLSVVAGLLAGANRREHVERAAQAQALLDERVRADAERDRAAALAERNRLGRELHDVLAHSLGALAVQLNAAEAVLHQHEAPDAVLDKVREARSTAVEGLAEARAAVSALRDEPIELAEQLRALAEREGVDVEVLGTPRPLAAEASLALYRAAQEAISNARKHAPDVPLELRLVFDPRETRLEAENPLAAGGVELARTGGGFGLRGMRERVELVGGRVDAARTASSFRLEVAVPA